MRKPLEGIKVVELTTFVAAPICGRMLADFGAEVIKVESPAGDGWRFLQISPSFIPNEEESPQFDIHNSGKKSIAINLKAPEGIEIMTKLIADADVFLTNTRVKSLKKLGLDYDTLKEKYPKLIYAVVTGFGEKGPDADSPGYDNVAFWTKTGFIQDMNVYPENSYPVETPSSVGDSVTGTTLLTGIIAALINRNTTGLGDYVTASLYGTGIWTMGSMIIKSQERYGDPYPKGRYIGRPLNQNYQCSDGEWIRFAILDFDKYGKKFLTAIGCNELIDNPDYQSIADFNRNSKYAIKRFEEIFRTKTSEEWLTILRANDIVCDPLTHFSDVPKSEQAWANGYIENFVCRNGAECIVPVNSVRMDSQPTPHSEPAPAIGENTVEIMRKLGYSDSEISDIAASGAIKVRK